MRRALLVGGVGGALCCMDCSLIDAAFPSMIGHVFSSGWQAAFFVAIAQVGMIVASAVGTPALTRLGSSGVKGELLVSGLFTSELKKKPAYLALGRGMAVSLF